MKEYLKAIAADIEEIKLALRNSKTVFTPKEAAGYMTIAPSTLYKLTSAGIIPFSKPNGKLIYFSKAGLDQWLLSNSSKSGEHKDILVATFISTNKNARGGAKK